MVSWESPGPPRGGSCHVGEGGVLIRAADGEDHVTRIQAVIRSGVVLELRIPGLLHRDHREPRLLVDPGLFDLLSGDL